jgi:DNA-binding cell septation regulator SpoVG
MEKFRILGVRKNSEEEREVVGYGDVEIAGLVKILNIKILQSFDGKRYCALPSLPFFSKRLNKRLFRATIHILDSVLKSELYNSILEEFARKEGLEFNGEGGEG